MLGHTFVGFIDNVMVGQLGTAELAAVSLGNSFIFIAMALGIGFSTAITPLIAEADASGNIPQGKSVLKHGLLLCTLLGIVLFVLVLLAKPLLYLMDQPKEVVVLAVPFINLVGFSLVPLVMFQAIKQFSDGSSQTKYPMYAIILANIVNIVLNYFLVFGIWVFPKLGITGSAIGTLVSRIVMFLFLWWLLQKNEKIKVYLINFNLRGLKKGMIKKLISLGFPSAMQMFFEVTIFTAGVFLSGVLGKNPQAANQIALNLSSMTYMVAIGLNVAAMIRVGNQKGLQNFSELKRIAISIFLLTFILEIVFAALFLVFKHWLPTLYLDENDMIHQMDNAEVIAIAAQLLLVAAFFQISDGLQVVILGALRGLQDVKIPTIITFIAYWMVGFPISYYLGLKTDYKSAGIWIGLLAGLTTAALLLYMRFHFLTQRLIRKNAT
jgi:multidrug resistance protein, MATE family